VEVGDNRVATVWLALFEYDAPIVSTAMRFARCSTPELLYSDPRYHRHTSLDIAMPQALYSGGVAAAMNVSSTVNFIVLHIVHPLSRPVGMGIDLNQIGRRGTFLM